MDSNLICNHLRDKGRLDVWWTQRPETATISTTGKGCSFLQRTKDIAIFGGSKPVVNSFCNSLWWTPTRRSPDPHLQLQWSTQGKKVCLEWFPLLAPIHPPTTPSRSNAWEAHTLPQLGEGRPPPPQTVSTKYTPATTSLPTAPRAHLLHCRHVWAEGWDQTMYSREYHWRQNITYLALFPDELFEKIAYVSVYAREILRELKFGLPNKNSYLNSLRIN